MSATVPPRTVDERDLALQRRADFEACVRHFTDQCLSLPPTCDSASHHVASMHILLVDVAQCIARNDAVGARAAAGQVAGAATMFVLDWTRDVDKVPDETNPGKQA